MPKRKDLKKILVVGAGPIIIGQACEFDYSGTQACKALRDEGYKVVLNIFPSVDTGVCATSIRKFNEAAAGMKNTKVLCVSRDLPFAQARFCGAEGLENVINLSDFNTGAFGKDYGLEIVESVLAGLHSRVVIVVDENGVVQYSEQVPEIANEPNYDAALAVL